VAELPGFIEKPAATPQTYRDLLFCAATQKTDPLDRNPALNVWRSFAAVEGMTVRERLFDLWTSYGMKDVAAMLRLYAVAESSTE
jgi:hypothetical protein